MSEPAVLTTPDGRPVRVFSVGSRVGDAQRYLQVLRHVTEWSERIGLSGVLLYSGNDIHLDVWMAAQRVMSESSTLMPLVAVNPAYMHPFAAARMLGSLHLLHRRRVFVNMIAGTALSHLEALGDACSHADRYQRLDEYLHILRALTESPRPVTFEGRYYRVRRLQLQPPLAADQRPGWVLAGQSAAAADVCARHGATQLQMLSPELRASGSSARGINFGVVVRRTDQEAWAAARRHYEVTEEGRLLLEHSMANTDAVWKQRMWALSRSDAPCQPGYWIGPFSSLAADGPCFVGGVERVAELFTSLVRDGIELFVLDVPPTAEDFEHLGDALRRAGATPPAR